MRIKQVCLSSPLMAVACPGAGNVRVCWACRRSGFDRNQELGVFTFHTREIFGAIKAHQLREFGTLQVLDQRSAPSQRTRGITKCAEGMANVELAIAEGALAIFPGFAPLNR